MATIVNMHQAKVSLSRLVERALAGEEVVIARNGEPLVQLMPVPKKAEGRHTPGLPDGPILAEPEKP
jgi:prevent-host-death family protein